MRAWLTRWVDLGLHYRALFPPDKTEELCRDADSDTTLAWIKSYFQLGVHLEPLYRHWCKHDEHFARKVASRDLGGIRVLGQDPWETLCAFICSSNNNIQRIGLMIGRVCEQLGQRMPHPSWLEHPELADEKSAPSLYSFPPPKALAASTADSLLRELGFGYRAPYIQSTAATLLAMSKEGGKTPDEYLEGLTSPHATLEEAREKLIEFKGVGRKVADCILLFSLGHHNVVPVDVHVFQIAIRDYAFPASKNTSLTPALNDKVAQRLQDKWGKKAGWAQQVLFYADLKTPSPIKGTDERGATSPSFKRTASTEVLPVKSKFERELEEVMSGTTPRKRRSVLPSPSPSASPSPASRQRQSRKKASSLASPVKKDVKMVVEAQVTTPPADAEPAVQVQVVDVVPVTGDDDQKSGILLAAKGEVKVE